jgi:hypothetical protein
MPFGSICGSGDFGSSTSAGIVVSLGMALSTGFGAIVVVVGSPSGGAPEAGRRRRGRRATRCRQHAADQLGEALVARKIETHGLAYRCGAAGQSSTAAE